MNKNLNIKIISRFKENKMTVKFLLNVNGLTKIYIRQNLWHILKLFGISSKSVSHQKKKTPRNRL